MRQLILDLLPEAPPTFDNFVAGSNEDALTGLAAWLATGKPGTLLLLGEAGSGKTHLLRAGNACFNDASINPDLSGIDDAALFHAVGTTSKRSAPPDKLRCSTCSTACAPLVAACSLQPASPHCILPCAKTCAHGLAPADLPPALFDRRRQNCRPDSTRHDARTAPAARSPRLPAGPCSARHAQPGCAAHGTGSLLAGTQAPHHPAAIARSIAHA